MEQIRRFFKEEDGAGVVEMVLIIVVLIGIVVIFRDQLTEIVNTIFERISGDAGDV